MANNFLQFSFAFSVSKTTAEYAADLAHQIAVYHDEVFFPDEDNEPTPVDPWVKSFVESYQSDDVPYEAEMQTDGNITLWFWAEEYGNVDAAAEFIQQLMKYDSTILPVCFTYAYTCSRPRLDEFGGGGIVVTADEIYYKDASTWCSDTVRALQERRAVA